LQLREGRRVDLHAGRGDAAQTAAGKIKRDRVGQLMRQIREADQAIDGAHGRRALQDAVARIAGGADNAELSPLIKLPN
jgi:hypothetical protein